MLFAYAILILFLPFSSAFAIEIRADFLEPGNPGGWTESLKTFENVWHTAPSETVDVDFWIYDVPNLDNDRRGRLITSGLWIDFDPAEVSIVSAQTYDGEKGPAGPWDSGLSVISPDALGPGTYQIVCGNLSCVNPDDNGDVIIARVKFRYNAGTAAATISVQTVPDFDTVVECGGEVYDLSMEQLALTISGEAATSTTTPSYTTTAPSSTSTTLLSTTTSGQITTTTTSSNTWRSVYTAMWGADADKKLALLRAFRNEANARSAVGSAYIALLYEHSREIATLLLHNPLLCRKTGQVIDVLLPHINAFFRTKTLNLTPAQTSFIESALNHFESEAGAQLKELIKNVKDDLRAGKLVL